MPLINSALANHGQMAPSDAARSTLPGYRMSYVTPDAIATVEAANYFNAAAAYFGRGPNLLDVIAGVGGTLVTRTYIAIRDANNVITLTRGSATAAV
jgi:hypothetical protein